MGDRAKLADVFASRGTGAGPFYESYFLKAADPDGQRAIWIRYTTHQVAGGPLEGTLWLTDFVSGRVRKAQLTDLPVTALEGGGLALGRAGRITPDGAIGELRSEQGPSHWTLSLTPQDEPLAHLGSPRRSTLPIPRTKLTSPCPDATFNGAVTLFGEEVALDGWRGIVGHNWGSQHAERWIWMHGSGFDADPTAWLDIGLARVRIGPVLTPWIAVGGHTVGGRRRIIRGIVKPTIGDHGDLQVEVRTDRGHVRISATAPASSTVTWTYDDPSGGRRQVRNSSLASLVLAVTPKGGAAKTLATSSATLELGGPPPA
jgi:hypothetical protein